MRERLRGKRKERKENGAREAEKQGRWGVCMKLMKNPPRNVLMARRVEPQKRDEPQDLGTLAN